MRSSHKPDLERVLKTNSRFGKNFFIGCKAIGGSPGPRGPPTWLRLGRANDESDIPNQNRAIPLHKNLFSENFCPVCDSLISEISTYKNADEKNIFFYGKVKV